VLTLDAEWHSHKNFLVNEGCLFLGGGGVYSQRREVFWGGGNPHSVTTMELLPSLRPDLNLEQMTMVPFDPTVTLRSSSRYATS